jgi:hypothetical protein
MSERKAQIERAEAMPDPDPESDKATVCIKWALGEHAAKLGIRCPCAACAAEHESEKPIQDDAKKRAANDED